jgi:GT2 family glycosyltransferase
MRFAQEAAVTSDPDYLVWLNDDVQLERDALAKLLATHRLLRSRGKPGSIVVGAMEDPDTGVTTYSGVIRRDRIRRMRFTIEEPAGEPRQCETMHGNLVLVPRSVYQRLGVLDAAFAHSMSDFDYGLRARANGCDIWIAPGHLGRCVFNRANPPGLDASFSFRERVRHLLSPKGLPPREWLRFTRRHGGVLWMGLFVAPYLRFLGRAAIPVRAPSRSKSRH